MGDECVRLWCKASFIAWEKCVDVAKEAEDNFVEICQKQTEAGPTLHFLRGPYTTQSTTLSCAQLEAAVVCS